VTCKLNSPLASVFVNATVYNVNSSAALNSRLGALTGDAVINLQIPGVYTLSQTYSPTKNLCIQVKNTPWPVSFYLSDVLTYFCARVITPVLLPP